MIEVSNYVINRFARTRYCYKVVLVFYMSNGCDLRYVDRVKKGNLLFLEITINMVE